MQMSLKDFTANAVGAVFALGVIVWITGPVVLAYPTSPVWLRVMAVFAAYAGVSCVGYGIGAFHDLFKYGWAREELLYPLLLIPILLWISYARYAVAVFGITLGPFVHAVIYFDQAALGWARSVWESIFPVSPFEPQVAVIFSAPQTIPKPSGAVSVVNWLLDSAWNIVLGLISSAIFAAFLALHRRQRAEA